MRLCVIPARGGSKRIPRKNIKPFHGRPMIGWSISAALESSLFDRVIVSTDDDEIAQVAEELGAEVPFLRPSKISGDHTATAPVIAHAALSLGLDDGDPVCCLYATAPLVRIEDLAEGLEHLENGARYAMSVTRFDYPIQRALRRSADGSVEMMDSDKLLTRSQDLEPAWHDAGQFYWGRKSEWCADSPIFGDGSYGVELPSYRVIDVDIPEDWARAEVLFTALGGGK